MSEPTIAERVARGAALMDEKVPGWAERIDRGRLDMESLCDCVIGQTFPGSNYVAAVVRLGMSAIRGQGLMPSDLGFDNGTPFGLAAIADEHKALRLAWLAEIARRAEGQAR